MSSFGKEPQPTTKLALIQALAKTGHDEQAIDTATQIGVDEVIPWQADRSIAKWKAGRTDKKWRQVLDAATEQSRRSWTPEFGGVRDQQAVDCHLQACLCARRHGDCAAPGCYQNLEPAGGSDRGAFRQMLARTGASAPCTWWSARKAASAMLKSNPSPMRELKHACLEAIFCERRQLVPSRYRCSHGRWDDSSDATRRRNAADYPGCAIAWVPKDNQH